MATQLLIAANTPAGTRVFPTRAAPVNVEEMPLLLVYTPESVAKSKGNSGQPSFSIVQTLVVEAKTAAVDEVQCGIDLDALMDPILDALLCDPAFISMKDDNKNLRIEEIATLESRTTVLKIEESGDRYIGRGLHIIGLRTAEVFIQRTGVPLASINATLDAGNLYSPTGTFTDVTDAGFPDRATPSPRTSGPDGRAESGFVIPFHPSPQTQE